MRHQKDGVASVLGFDPVIHNPLSVTGYLCQSPEFPDLGELWSREGAGHWLITKQLYYYRYLEFEGSFWSSNWNGCDRNAHSARAFDCAIWAVLSLPPGAGGLGSHLSILHSQMMVMYLNGLGCQVIYLLFN